MATAICNNIVVVMSNFNSATDAANRTLTTTRPLRMMDLKVRHVQNVVGVAVTLSATVSNGVTLCITKDSPGSPTANTVVRLGQNANDRRIDASAAVPAGGTIVFANNNTASIDATLHCWPL